MLNRQTEMKNKVMKTVTQHLLHKLPEVKASSKQNAIYTKQLYNVKKVGCTHRVLLQRYDVK